MIAEVAAGAAVGLAAVAEETEVDAEALEDVVVVTVVVVVVEEDSVLDVEVTEVVVDVEDGQFKHLD